MKRTIKNTTEYLKHIVDSEKTNPALQYDLREEFSGIYFELAKLELNRRGVETPGLVYDNWKVSMDRVRQRIDCGDFVIPAMLAVLFDYHDSPMVTPELLKELEETMLGYKYWLDEPSEETIHTCFFTENHQILFHSIEYLVGQLFPDKIFTNNGKNGEWHKQHAKAHLTRWLEWRKKFGFSEWLSNCYYAVDLIALPVLARYVDDDDIRIKAQMLTDLLLFDLVLHTHNGVFGATSGRMYNANTMNPEKPGTAAIYAVLFGEGYVDGGLMPGAVLLAAFDYRPAKALTEITKDRTVVEVRERMSLNVEDSERYGIDPSDFDNIMLYWGLHTFHHRKVIENSRKFCPDWYSMSASLNVNLEKFQLCEKAGVMTDQDPNGSALTQVDIYTYRTPNYMLSCAQNYRAGRTNFQQHIWQATLGGRAVVFTTHPGAGSNDYNGRPNYFVGNGHMPKAAAYRNVALVIYRIPAESTRDYCTHAYFPVHEFDEFFEENGWLFGRKDNGYIALHSLLPRGCWRPKEPALFQTVYHDTWKEEFEKAEQYDYWVAGHANVWICEMGEPETHGSFEEFRAAVSNAHMEGDTFHFRYDSPSVGTMEFGWTEPLKVGGTVVPINDYPRYDTPYCKAPFDTNHYEISCHGEKLVLDFENLNRSEIEK